MISEVEARSDRVDPSRKRVLSVASVFVFVAMFIQFYWTTLRTHFRLLSGDSGDAALIAFLHEHVYQSIFGHASLRDPQFFYPIHDVLGYTDAFLLNQIFYSPLRLLGAEPLLAAQLTFMALTVIGGIAFAAVLVRFFGVRIWVAILAAAIFAFGHALYIKTSHPQHYTIDFVPVVAYLALAAILQEGSPTGTAALSFSAALLYGLCFATGYYMSWLTAFFLLFALPVFVALYRDELVQFVQANRKRLVIGFVFGAIGFCIGASLVVWIYIPAIDALRGLSNQNFLANAATFRDIINVSDANLLWGKLLPHIIPLNRLQHTELALAVTPLLVLTSVVGTIFFLRVGKRSQYERLVLALCLAILFGYGAIYLFTITYRGAWSLFFIVQKILPGAIAIRVGFRSQVVSALFVTVAVSLVAEAYLRRRANQSELASDFYISVRSSLVVFCLGIVLALEQVDTRQLALLDRSAEIAILSNVKTPPPQCRAFAIYNDGSRALAAIHIDAMRISQRFGLPTVNGYSGGVPKGWNLSNVWEPMYISNVRAWADANAIERPICLYDSVTNAWRNLDNDVVRSN